MKNLLALGLCLFWLILGFVLIYNRASIESLIAFSTASILVSLANFK